jgi:hypothetical protein
MSVPAKNQMGDRLLLSDMWMILKVALKILKEVKTNIYKNI